ncbi:hypothetical protein BJ878DRAFT_512346 [Calycina marina]|uniref:Uncharacterized protein n=1 Tax=Calycina marina TaxID=1763456 RepID=A0A9P8CDK2_9HELO|nr:hypothetical protein BJ878DRAFT_512346 [Calycina marina]
MSDRSYEYLIGVLRDHDIPHDQDAIKEAFKDRESQAAIYAWVEEYLSPETVLTKEEAALYETLVRNGDSDVVTAAHNLSAIRGLDDDEIRDAVEELKRSTTAIEKQTEALNLQQDAMSTLIKNKTGSDQVRAQIERSQLAKWNAEKSQIGKSVEELAQNLKYSISDLGQQLKASEKNVRQTVETILRSDDKLLNSLQKLAGELDPRSDDDEIIAKIRDLCARLIKHTVEGIRTKLDRIFLEAAGNSKVAVSGARDMKEVSDLQEELETLYSEILPVAQMSTEQQYLEPALQEISSRNGHGQRRSVKAVGYINECLTVLNDRLNVFLERSEEFQSHSMAVNYVLDEAQRELATSLTTSQKKSKNPIKANHARYRSPVSAPPVKARGRRSSGTVEDPEQQLLCNLGISQADDSIPDEERLELFERALSDRRKKLDSHASALQSTTESSISAYLLDSHLTLQQLRDSLLADSKYNKVQLLDAKTKSGLAAFDAEVQSVQERLENIDLENFSGRNVHKEQIIERWSR